MARSLKKLFDNLRGSFYQAKVQARQAGAFLENPFTFSWRVVRGFFTNWLNSDEENRITQGEEESNAKPDTEKQTEVTLTLKDSNKTYLFTGQLIVEQDFIKVFWGSQQEKSSDQNSDKISLTQPEPVFLQEVDEKTFKRHKNDSNSSTKDTKINRDARLVFESNILETTDSSPENNQSKRFYYVYRLNRSFISINGKSPLLADSFKEESNIQDFTYQMLLDILQSLETWEDWHKKNPNEKHRYRPLNEFSFLIDGHKKVYVVFWHDLNQEQPNRNENDVTSLGSVIETIETVYLHDKQKILKDELKDREKTSFKDAYSIVRGVTEKTSRPEAPIVQPQDPETQSPEGRDNRLTQFVNWFKRSLRSNPQDSQGNTTETETSSNTSRRRSKSRRRPGQVLLFWFLFGLTLILFVIPFIPTAWQRIANSGVTRVLSTQSTPPPTFQTCFPNSTNSSPYPCLMRNQASSPPSPVTITYGDMVEHIFGNEDFKTQFQERTGKSDWSWVNTASPEAPEMDNLDDAVLEITVVSPNSSDNLQGDGRVIGYDGLAIFGGRSTSRILDDQISKAELVKVLKDINNARLPRNGSSLGLNLPRNRPDWETTLRTLICSDADCPLTEQAQPGEAQTLSDYLDQIRPDATVGVAPLSFVKSQCQIYSVAIEGEHPLVNFHGQALTSETELCDQKGGYWPDLDRITTLEYPLSYAIVVRPSPGQEQLAEELVNLLRTDEGQSLLRGFGLTPCRFPNGDETQERCQLQ